MNEHTVNDGACESVAVFKVLKNTFICKMLDANAAFEDGVSWATSMFICPAAGPCWNRTLSSDHPFEDIYR